MEPIPLSEADRAILGLEGPTILGHTCKVVRLEAPGIETVELRQRIEERLDHAPPLRARLGGDDHAPAWVEYPGFDVARHVVRAAEAPLDDPDLAGLVSRRFEERLDRELPLWRIDVASTSDGGTALIWRIHHALADGTTATRFARALLWDQGPAPSAGQPAHRHAADEDRRQGHLAAFAAREFAESVHSSPFDGQVGTRRSLAFGTVPFDRLHAAAKAAGATVNDAVLTVVAGGLHRWLAEHHDDVGTLRMRVPVSLHHEGDDAANDDSFFTVPVPVAGDDARRRLSEVHAAAAARKSAHDAEHLAGVLESLRSASPRLEALAERLQSSPRSFALCVSNVPGPRDAVSVAGRRVTSIHTFAEVGRRHGLRVAVISAAGRLGFGFCADPLIAPDLDAMARGTESTAEELIAGT